MARLLCSCLLNRAANRNAAYLCEQAAEKLIRAVLTSEGIQGGVRHELPDMVAKIPDANPVKPLLRAIEHLDAYATAYRYPSPRGRVKTAPTPAEIDQDIVKIDAALVEIVVTRAGDKLVFDFGEFKSEIASRKNPDGTTSFLTIVPGFGGLDLVAGEAAGKRILTFRDAQHEYVFTEK